MEERVVSLTESYVREVSWKKGTRPSSSYWLLVITGLGLGVILSFGVQLRVRFEKRLTHFRKNPDSPFSLNSLGLLFLPANYLAMSLPEGRMSPFMRDIFVDTVAKSAMLHFKSKRGVESFAMLDTPGLGRFELMIPSIQQPFEYQSTTPSLESGMV